MRIWDSASYLMYINHYNSTVEATTKKKPPDAAHVYVRVYASIYIYMYMVATPSWTYHVCFRSNELWSPSSFSITFHQIRIGIVSESSLDVTLHCISLLIRNSLESPLEASSSFSITFGRILIRT